MTIRTEREHAINGVVGRMMAAHAWSHAPALFSTQTWKASRQYHNGPTLYRMTVELRFDDNCKNGHASFAATCDIDTRERGRWIEHGGGAAHDEMARVFPELAPLFAWHLVSTDGPLHYVANTLYHAGDRDYYGLRAGETRQRCTNKGTPMWELVARAPDGTMLRCPDKYTGQTTVPLYALETLHSGPNAPATPVLIWGPSMRTGDGKERDLAAARRCAVWPDATDVELTEPGLEARLMARLPGVIAAFRAAMCDVCGFEWSATP